MPTRFNVHTYSGSDGHHGGNLGFKYIAQENLVMHTQEITDRLIGSMNMKLQLATS